MNKAIFLVVSMLLTVFAIGQTSKYWIATSPGTWSDSLNWSTTLNGPSGGGIPRNGEIAIFDGSNKGSCIVDINLNLNKLETRNGFNGEINIEASQVTIGSGGLKHNAGTFNCSTSGVTISGDLTITAEFVSTSASLILRSNFLLDSTSHFDPADGTVLFNAVTSNSITGAPQFYTLVLKGIDSGISTVTASQGFSVYQDLIIDQESRDIRINGGTISMGGDLYSAGVWKPGTAKFNMNGLGNQQLYIDGTVEFSSLSINKISGSVISRGSLSIDNELILNQGNIILGNSDSLVLDTLSVVTGSSEKSFVDGRVIKTGNADFVFPCGSNTTYAPVTISNLSGIHPVSCRYYSSNTPNQTQISTPVNFIDPCSYWLIEGAPGKTMKITFSPFEYKTCMEMDAITDGELLSNTSGTWNQETITNTTTAITTVSITPAGFFALGSSGTAVCTESPLYWVGAVSTSWSDAQNWSNTSGGPGGYGVPCKSSTIIFDGNGNVDCDLSANVEVAMALFRPDYTAEIATNGFQIRIKELFK